jgi:hypothetical protein
MAKSQRIAQYENAVSYLNGHVVLSRHAVDAVY